MFYDTTQPSCTEEDDDNCGFFDDDGNGLDDRLVDEDLLNVSAHSSGGGSLGGGAADDTQRQTPNDVDDDSGDAGQPDDAAHHANFADDGLLLVDDGDTNDVSDDEKIIRLSAEATMLLERFHRFFAEHPHVPGMSKLRTRFEREVELATEALTGQPIVRTTKHRCGDEQGDKDGGVKTTKRLQQPPHLAISANRPSYVKCNCIPLLELTMHVLENEPNVASVMHPVNPTLLKKVLDRQRQVVPKSCGESGDALPSREDARSAATSSGFLAQWELPPVAFEVDIITCGGLRWIKIKGTSRRNLELELSACADRRPFSSVLETIVRGATCCRQPFGVLPKVDVLIYYKPSLNVVVDCGDAVQSATRNVRVSYACGSAATSCRGEIADVKSSTCAPPAEGQPRCCGDAYVDLTFRVFESSLKAYLLHHHASLVTVGQPDQQGVQCRPKQFSWAQVPLDERFRLMPAMWSKWFLPPLELKVDFINFDVTAMVALCSDTCNGYAGHPIPKHAILEEQSLSEVHDASVLGYIEPCLRKYSRKAVTCRSDRKAAGRTDDRDDDASCGVASVRAVMGQHIAAVGGDPSKLNVSPVRGLGLSLEQRGKLGISLEAPEDADGFVCPPLHDNNNEPLFYASDTLRSLLPPSNCGMVPSLDKQRMNWVVSDVALSEFLWIVGTIAGPKEYRRAVHLLRHMYVVSSSSLASSLLCPAPPSTAAAGGDKRGGGLRSMDAVFHLENTGKLADRHKAVFGLGNAVHAISISANRQFSQAARDQGIEVCVCHHPSRALTERKRLGGDRMDGPRQPPSLLL